MPYASIGLEVHDGLARLTLNQPDAGNPIDSRFCEEWLAIANELSARPDVRAILLTASGRFFSVGGDIRLFVDDLDGLPDTILRLTGPLHAGIARLLRLDAPIIAAVHATCAGGACSLISNFDLVYGARSARFGANYAQIGFSCDAGATTGLVQRLGIARARRFLLGAEVLKAEAAAKIGLVDFVVDDAALYEEAEKAAVRLSRGPTRAYGALRRLINRSLGQPLEAQMENEAQAQAQAGAAAMADAREGISAFIEKREAIFLGR